jgi:peptidyl-lysine (3S)-dioxygenase / protease
MNERTLPGATYYQLRDSDSSSGQRADENATREIVVEDLIPRLDEPGSSIPFATWDPDAPDLHPTHCSRVSRPIRVTLDPGDMLYLPALWYHKVSQSCDSEDGVCVAVNYW